MILAILSSFAVHVSIKVVSFYPRSVFSGGVYASPGVPIKGALVVATGIDGYGYAITDDFGNYSINEGLKTGSYNVRVIAEGYLEEEVENVPVTVGSETSGVDFYLNLSGGISGRVTDAVSGWPLPNITIIAVYLSYGGSAVTDLNGNYSIITNLATGTYNVTAIYPEGYFTRTVSGIAVTAGVETTGIDLALDRSGAISGKVTASGTPLGGAMVVAESIDKKYNSYASTNATGYYKISTGLGTGNYNVTASYGIGQNKVSNVTVVAGEETKGIDVAISVSPPPPSGIIMGKVSDINGNPIVNALVTAEGPAGSGQDYADWNGNYVISQGLGGTGIYTVRVNATGYLSSLTNVSVTVGEVTSNINFQLSRIPPEQSGIISGTTSGDENPISEFQYPIATFLIITLAVAVLTKLINVKTRRIRPHYPRSQPDISVWFWNSPLTY